MQIGMTSLTLRNYTPAQVIAAAKEVGIQGIEWGVSDGHMPLEDAARAREIRELSEESSIEIFSLGSYCNMENRKECDRTLHTAVMLGAPIIRIWAGRKSPADCEEEYRRLIIDNTIYMSECAAAHNITLGFEYHPYTLTETCEDALALVRSVNRSNVGLYWQPGNSLSAEENVRDRDRVLPCCVGNIHVQNYSPENGYGLLEEIKDRLQAYFGDICGEPYRVMIEFVKDASVENLKADAAALLEMIRR